MKTRWMMTLFCAAALAAAGCGEATVVASNCDDPEGCVKPEPAPLKIDAVDILLVLDNSVSIVGEAERLQAELPRLLEALTTGEVSIAQAVLRNQVWFDFPLQGWYTRVVRYVGVTLHPRVSRR